MPSRPRQFRLGKRHETSVYLCVAALVLTGLLWLLFHSFVVVQGDFGEQHHPLEAWWLRLHGFAGMGGLLLFGSLMPLHIRNAWQHGANRWSGGALVVLLSVLTLSAYGLYYAGAEETRAWISTFHWVAGCALGLGLPLHIQQRRRNRRRAAVARTQPAATAPANALRLVRGRRDTPQG